MTTYPIYRKFKNRNVFVKVLSDTNTVTVHTGGPEADNDKASIVITANRHQRSDAVNDKYSEPSNFEDFEKAYGEAMWKFNKTREVL